MKKILTITCGSFTSVIILFALLSPYGFAPAVTNDITFQVFLMSVSIALIMTLAERIDYDSLVIDVLVKVLICYLVVFFEGALFGMIPFSWHGFWEITPVLIPAFLITYLFHYITCMECASYINHIIHHKK